MVLRLVLFGAPGAGKGTQAGFLERNYRSVHVSTGDIFRQAMRQGTPLGKKAQAYIDAGQLVPDDIVIGLVQVVLRESIGEKGFIFDGFPRTVPQAEMLEKVLATDSKGLDAVVSLDVAEDVLVRRISGRRICPQCGSLYHVDNLPKGSIKCSRDGAELEQRKDDSEEAVKIRLIAFNKQTLPLKRFYRERNLLLEIDGDGAPEEVFARVAKAIDVRFSVSAPVI